MDLGVILVCMVVKAMDTNDAGKGEKHRNKEKEKQGEKIEKLYISGRGKS